MPIIRTDKPLRSRVEHDFYPTPPQLIAAVFDYVGKNQRSYLYYGPPKKVLDLGAGEGEWGKVAKEYLPESEVTGVDIRELPKPVGYDHWITADALQVDLKEEYDLVIGNPPYKFAESFIRQGFAHLHKLGLMVYLLPLQFLASQKRGKGLWKEHTLSHLAVCSRRPSFTRNGKTDNTDYGIFIWNNHSIDTTLGWLDWDYE